MKAEAQAVEEREDAREERKVKPEKPLPVRYVPFQQVRREWIERDRRRPINWPLY